MKIEVETLDAPRRDFYDLRKELIASGKKFDETNLRFIPYDQLHLCCIGNAGEAVCLPRLVQAEKAARRERFLHMESEEFKAAEIFLKIERMYDDVMYAIAYRNAPKWDDLKYRQRAWAKLTCLYNHVDDPFQRLGEAVLVLRKCSQPLDNDGLPPDYCMNLMNKLKGLSTVFPGRLSDDGFRQKIAELAYGLLEFLPDEERTVLEKEQLQDYSCTSDCFRVLV